MPPVNVNFATALDLGAVLPIDNTQGDINDAGTNYTVFYKFTCPAGLKMVWAWATSDQVAGYMPKMVPYDQAQVEILSESFLAPLGNNPIQFPVTPGQVHYLQVVKNADSVGPEHVDLQIRATPNEAVIPGGAIIINGDIQDQPCGIFSPTTNYQTIKWIKNIAIGEGGDITPSGRLLLGNNVLADRFIKMYEGNDLTEIGTNATLAFCWIRYNRVTGKFWILVMENAGFSKLYRLDPTVLPLVKTLVATITGAGSGSGISTNAAETIAYYQEGGALGLPVHRWNLSTDSAMADFAAAPGPGYTFIDTLVLEDDTVLVGWSSNDGPTGVVKIRHYNPAGAQLHEYEFNSFENGSYGICRLAYAHNDSPLSFWVKLRERSGAVATGDCIINRVRVSDGAVLNSLHHLEYHERNYIGPAATSYRGQSGIWNSCPLIIYPGALTPPLHGLLFNNPGIRHDIYPDQARKIPNPTIRTALVGD